MRDSVFVASGLIALSASFFGAGWIVGAEAGTNKVVEVRKAAYAQGREDATLSSAKIAQLCKAWWFDTTGNKGKMK
jgi:hypothetical protein